MIKVVMRNKESKTPTFADVPDDQLFVMHGQLCQKGAFNTYNVIADGGGVLDCYCAQRACPDDSVDRILEVERIEF